MGFLERVEIKHRAIYKLSEILIGAVFHPLPTATNEHNGKCREQ